MQAQPLSLAEQLKRANHKICALILYSDLEWVDIAIEIEAMRQLCLDAAPEKEEFFDAIYVSRFQRLWEQWHDDRPPTQPDWMPRPWSPDTE